MRLGPFAALLMVRVVAWFLRSIVSGDGEWSRDTSTFVVERSMGAAKVDLMEVFGVNSKSVREMLGALRNIIVLCLVEDLSTIDAQVFVFPYT